MQRLRSLFSADDEQSQAVAYIPLQPLRHIEAEESSTLLHSPTLDSAEESTPLAGNESPSSDAPSTTSGTRFHVNMAVVMLVLFLSEAARGIVIPTLNLYAESFGCVKTCLGVAIALFSGGRLLTTVATGYWAEWRGVKEPLLMLTVLAVVGQLLYALLPTLGNSSVLFLMSRFLIGSSTGNLGVARAYIAAVTTTEQRVRYYSISGIVQFAGFSLTPLIAAFLAIGDQKLLGIHVNENTAPGYLMALLCIAAILMLLFAFDDTDLRAPPAKAAQSGAEASGDFAGNEHAYLLAKWLGICLFFYLNVVLRGVLAVVEALGPGLHHETFVDHDNDYAWDAGLYFATLGLAGVLVFLAIEPVTRRVMSEQWLLVLGILVGGVGAFITMDFDRDLYFWQFTLGASLIWSVSSPICQTLTVSTFSKILGTQPQGKWMGWLASAGSVGRMVLPIIGTLMVPGAAFLMCGMLDILSAILVLAYMHTVYRLKEQARAQSVHQLL